MRRAEKLAFDIRALQSRLMISALKCNDGGYNVFLNRHQAEVSDAYIRITGYFARINHTSGEDERDLFITEMANAHEQAGLRLGASFCASMRGLSSDALAVQTAEEISDLVNRSGTDLTRFEVCEEEAAPRLGRPVIKRSPPANTDRQLHDLLRRLGSGQ